MRQTLWEKPKDKKAFSSISNLALFPIYLWFSLAVMSGLAWPTFLFCEEAESNPADQSHEWSTTTTRLLLSLNPAGAKPAKKTFLPACTSRLQGRGAGEVGSVFAHICIFRIHSCEGLSRNVRRGRKRNISQIESGVVKFTNFFSFDRILWPDQYPIPSQPILAHLE